MKITVVGGGIRGATQLSLEGASALKTARQVYFLTGSAQEVQSTLTQLGISGAHDLLSLYVDGAADKANYQTIFNRLVSDCRQYGHIAFLVPGHPRIGVSVVQMLEKQHEALGIELEVLPGISSFATMINDLKRDPLERGSVIIDANRLLLYQIPVAKEIDHYIYHVCSIGTSRVHISDASIDNRLDLLKAHLLKFLDSSHEAILICSSVEATGAATLRKTTVGELETLLPHIHFGTTLFLPAAKAESFDRGYLKLLAQGLR